MLGIGDDKWRHQQISPRPQYLVEHQDIAFMELGNLGQASNSFSSFNKDEAPAASHKCPVPRVRQH